MQRRAFTASCAAIGISALSGCITSKMHEDGHYYETVSAILITDDKTKIAVLGEKYHYIFDAPPLLIHALSADFGKNLSAVFDAFTLGNGNSISGNFHLYLSSANAQTTAQAAALGFKITNNTTLDIKIDGERFVADKPLPMNQAYKLNRAYSVKIVEPDSAVTKAAKIAVTPITAAADGVLILGAVILSPIWITMMLGAAPYSR